MGLFKGKQQTSKTLPVQESAADVVTVFDDTYREELRAVGRESFTQLISDNAPAFKESLDATIAQVGTELKERMTSQLDATIAQINTALVTRLDERLAESDRVTKDAQDMVVQSLNRNAQVLHDKYQQLSQTLQQTIASQEAMMITVFEENKSRMTTTQNSQEMILTSLRENVKTSQDQTTQLSETLKKTIADQEAMITGVFQETAARIAATKTAQDTAQQSLDSSAKALQEQYQQLSQSLEANVARQESVMIGAFEGNMAQIVEHYLLGALGDQFDMKAQLPLIIQQMETNKQAIVDDMKL